MRRKRELLQYLKCNGQGNFTDNEQNAGPSRQDAHLLAKKGELDGPDDKRINGDFRPEESLFVSHDVYLAFCLLGLHLFVVSLLVAV